MPPSSSSSISGGHQMARLRVPQPSPSSSSSLPTSGQKGPARPSVRSAPSVPTQVSTSSRSGVPAPTAPKYLRTSKYLSTPSPVAPRTTSSRSSIPIPASRSPVAPKATSIPSPRPLTPGESFLKRFDEKHPNYTRSIPVPVARSPVAPRTTSPRSTPQMASPNGPAGASTRLSPSVAPRTTSTRSSIPIPSARSPVAPKATSAPSPRPLTPGESFLKRFDEKHPTYTRSSLPVPAPRSSVAPRTTSTRSSIPTPASRSPVAPRTTSPPSSVAPKATSIPSPLPLSKGASFLKRFDEKHPNTRSPVDLRTTSIPSPPVALRTTSTRSGENVSSRLQAMRDAYHRSRDTRAPTDAARKSKSGKSVQFSEVTTVITVDRSGRETAPNATTNDRAGARFTIIDSYRLTPGCLRAAGISDPAATLVSAFQGVAVDPGFVWAARLGEAWHPRLPGIDLAGGSRDVPSDDIHGQYDSS
ncbi:hypothetical protein AbraIFM66950_000838 [Aspergillus brasiliensis]|nr:hypothetical protein AbraIFM66950_000838 [Aspergillus brasiliensis]